MTFDAAGATWFVLDISLRALAAAAAFALVMRLLRLRAAVVLHLAWSALLFAMLLMPFFSSIVPRFPVPVPASAGGLFVRCGRCRGCGATCGGECEYDGKRRQSKILS